jgi:hypothetical protein
MIPCVNHQGWKQIAIYSRNVNISWYWERTPALNFLWRELWKADFLFARRETREMKSNRSLHSARCFACCGIFIFNCQVFREAYKHALGVAEMSVTNTHNKIASRFSWGALSHSHRRKMSSTVKARRYVCGANWFSTIWCALYFMLLIPTTNAREWVTARGWRHSRTLLALPAARSPLMQHTTHDLCLTLGDHWSR